MTNSTLTARQSIVDILVRDKQNQLASDADFARHVLTNGFPGFSNMSASQLHCMVCDAGLDSQDGMGLLLHELAHEKPLMRRVSRGEEGVALPVSGADPLLALAAEIRRYFQNEAPAPMVKLMIDTLGPLAETIRAEDDFKALDSLTGAQLRRLTPVTLALRERVKNLLAVLEGQA